MMSFALSSGRGLLVFSPDEVTYLVTSHFDRPNAMDWNSSTVVLNLATSLVRLYSGKNKPDIHAQIDSLIDHLTKTLLPPLTFPESSTFSPELLQDSHVSVFQEMIRSYPELYYKYFEFIGTTMYRYSMTWKQDLVQRWMTCILVSLSQTEAGMSFQGAVEFLVSRHFTSLNEKTNLVEKVNGHDPPETVVSVFGFFREAIFAQTIMVCAFSDGAKDRLYRFRHQVMLFLCCHRC
jgi:hypothetical protein